MVRETTVSVWLRPDEREILVWACDALKCSSLAEWLRNSGIGRAKLERQRREAGELSPPMELPDVEAMIDRVHEQFGRRCGGFRFGDQIRAIVIAAMSDVYIDGYNVGREGMAEVICLNRKELGEAKATIAHLEGVVTAVRGGGA